MSLAICPECRNKVSDQAHKCPYCGVPFGNSQLNTQINWIVGVVLTLTLLFISLYFYKEHKDAEEKAEKREEYYRASAKEDEVRAIINMGKDHLRKLDRVEDQLLRQLND